MPIELETKCLIPYMNDVDKIIIKLNKLESYNFILTAVIIFVFVFAIFLIMIYSFHHRPYLPEICSSMPPTNPH